MRSVFPISENRLRTFSELIFLFSVTIDFDTLLIRILMNIVPKRVSTGFLSFPLTKIPGFIHDFQILPRQFGSFYLVCAGGGFVFY